MRAKNIIIVMIVINLLIFSVVFPIQKTKADTINISPQAIPITVPVGIGAEILGGFLAGGLLAGLKDTFGSIGKNITDFLKNNIGVQQLEYDYVNHSEWILADDKFPSLKVKASAFSAVTSSSDFIPMVAGGIGASVGSYQYMFSDTTNYTLIDAIPYDKFPYMYDSASFNLGNSALFITLSSGSYIVTGDVTFRQRNYRYIIEGDIYSLQSHKYIERAIVRNAGGSLYNTRIYHELLSLENLLVVINDKLDRWYMPGTTISIIPSTQADKIISEYNSIINTIDSFTKDIVIPGDVIATYNGLTWDGTNFINASSGAIVDAKDIAIPMPNVYENEKTKKKDVGWWVDEGTFINTDGQTIVGEYPTEPINPPDTDTGGIIQSIKNIYNWLIGWLADILLSIRDGILTMIDHISNIPIHLSNIYHWLTSTLINTLTLIKDAVISIPGTLSNIFNWVSDFTLSGVESLLSVISSTIVGIKTALETIGQVITDALTYVFVPDMGLITSNYGQLESLFFKKFPFLAQVPLLIDEIKAPRCQLDNVNLSYMGTNATILDFDYVKSVSNWIKPIIRSLIWLLVGFYIYRKLPAMLSGRGGAE